MLHKIIIYLYIYYPVYLFSPFLNFLFVCRLGSLHRQVFAPSKVLAVGEASWGRPSRAGGAGGSSSGLGSLINTTLPTSNLKSASFLPARQVGVCSSLSVHLSFCVYLLIKSSGLKTNSHRNCDIGAVMENKRCPPRSNWSANRCFYGNVCFSFAGGFYFWLLSPFFFCFTSCISRPGFSPLTPLSPSVAHPGEEEEVRMRVWQEFSPSAPQTCGRSHAAARRATCIIVWVVWKRRRSQSGIVLMSSSHLSAHSRLSESDDANSSWRMLGWVDMKINQQMPIDHKGSVSNRL